MKDGFVSCACCTPHVTVCDVAENVRVLKEEMKTAAAAGARVVVFPELCITGYTAGDLFGQQLLIEKAEEGLLSLAAETGAIEGIFFFGLPFAHRGKLYNVAAACAGGRVLGLVPKTYLPSYREFYEVRQFEGGRRKAVDVTLADGQIVPFGTDILFEADCPKGLVIAAEICEDLWVPDPPSSRHAVNGATCIVNLSASDEIVGKGAYRRSLVENQSARLYSAYLYACAGPSESTQDLVFAGHSFIAESGSVLAESALFSEDMILSEIDVQKLTEERRRMTTFPEGEAEDYTCVPFHLTETETVLTRKIDPYPFVPADEHALAERSHEILDIQTMGLVKRLVHTKAKTAVLGISGGLDSTLALLVTARAFDRIGKDRKDIVAVTMPGFGTTDRTYRNAVAMIRGLGASFREIPIGPAVTQHFRDIGYDPAGRDVTYENSQARERTQILMDVANETGGLVIGTGDLSELALGWATYNGDHMSMYGVNASVPKTLVRHLVRFCAGEYEDQALVSVLYDILDTPISPELLPPEDGKISQKTEDLVGPYALHDFFLYCVMRYGYAPKKVLRLAECAFAGTFDRPTIIRWENRFYHRFFSQQFKRSALPDGPKVGSVTLSPRGDWRMPTDASSALWLQELSELSL